MSLRHYILEPDGTVKAVPLLVWARWFEDSDKRRIAQIVIGEARVSTVFLGLDHRFSLEGPPILFETMVFGGALDGEMERYTTLEAAKAGHAAMVARIRAQPTRHYGDA